MAVELPGIRLPTAISKRCAKHNTLPLNRRVTSRSDHSIAGENVIFVRKGSGMTSLIVIGLFIVSFVVLNVVEKGRWD